VEDDEEVGTFPRRAFEGGGQGLVIVEAGAAPPLCKCFAGAGELGVEEEGA
jgi:hypothetical protein